jgi:hypothetical protein
VACDCKLEFFVRTLGSSIPHLKRELGLRADEKEPFSVFFRELPPLRKCRPGVCPCGDEIWIVLAAVE